MRSQSTSALVLVGHIMSFGLAFATRFQKSMQGVLSIFRSIVTIGLKIEVLMLALHHAKMSKQQSSKATAAIPTQYMNRAPQPRT